MARPLRNTLLVLAAAVVLLFLLHNQLLAALGGYLQNSEAPQKADIALVLAGDLYGRRILTAGDLVRQGYAPNVLVSGPAGNYGYHESDLAIPFAVKRGYPESYFIPLPNEAHSTREEAEATIPEIRKRGAHRVLLVTSTYHTRRAGKIFRAKAPDLTFIVVASPDTYFTPEGWWHDREAQKVFAFEWMKTIATALGL